MKGEREREGERGERSREDSVTPGDYDSISLRKTRHTAV